MSSKLHRGGRFASDPVTWERVASAPPARSPQTQRAVQSAAAGEADETPGPKLAKEIELREQFAEQRGFQEGQASVKHEAAAQLDAMHLRFARTIEELSGLRSRFRHESEEEVVALALAVARRVLHRELTVSPDALLGLVKAALGKMEIRELLRIRVPPQDVSMVQKHLETIGIPGRVEVIADAALERGAAVLDSIRGSLDVSVETQLAEIERGFVDLVRRT